MAKRFDRITISERPEEDSSVSLDEQSDRHKQEREPIDRKREEEWRGLIKKNTSTTSNEPRPSQNAMFK